MQSTWLPGALLGKPAKKSMPALRATVQMGRQTMTARSQRISCCVPFYTPLTADQGRCNLCDLAADGASPIACDCRTQKHIMMLEPTEA
jgi:hypothetical protein